MRGRIRLYTEFVNVDLGGDMGFGGEELLLGGHLFPILADLPQRRSSKYFIANATSRSRSSEELDSRVDHWSPPRYSQTCIDRLQQALV